jgi:enoyl-CoA hydratase/carnithine racemase
LTGKVYAASDPLLANLFTEVLDRREQVLPRALELAKEMATLNSAVSMALVKGLVHHGVESPEGQHLLESRGMFVTGNSEDGAEGVASFMEKRPVKFQGSVTKDMPDFYPVHIDCLGQS